MKLSMVNFGMSQAPLEFADNLAEREDWPREKLLVRMLVIYQISILILRTGLFQE